MTAPQGILARLGLGTPALRAWALYDWAMLAVYTVVITAVFPIYFQKVAAAGLRPATASERYASTTVVAIFAAVVLSPLVGAVADARPLKKRVLALCVSVGALATAALGLAGRGTWAYALVCFAVVNVAANVGSVVYDAILPHLARPGELDRASAAGYGLGYVGGGIALALALLAITKPAALGLGAVAARDPTAPTRYAFIGAAVWWAVFTLPLLRRVPEPPAAPRPPGVPVPSVGEAVRGSVAALLHTARTLARLPDTAWFLVAFVLYNDAINTIIRLAALYGAELGLRENALIGAILLVQFVGIPFAFAFGWVADRIGTKRAVLLAIGVYLGIAVLAYGMRTERDFYALALLVATVQGGAQALSRSLYASLVPASRSGEFFALFSVFHRFGGLIGPTAFAFVVRHTGSSRLGILSVVLFFAAGGLLLLRVNVARGRADARALDAAAREGAAAL